MPVTPPAPIQTFPARDWADVAELVDQALSRQSGLVGVAIVDVDHFSDLVPPGDHKRAEALNSEFVRRISGLVLPGDITAQFDHGRYLIARHPLTGPAEMEGLGLRIVESFTEPVSVGDQRHQTSVSVGVATSRAGDSADSLCRYAHHALDDAKALGRNRMVAFVDEDREMLAIPGASDCTP